MEPKYINPFFEALERVLSQFGVSEFRKGNLQGKQNMQVNLDITSVIGLVGNLRGNVSYSLAEDTAKKIDEEVSILIDKAYKNSKRILEKNIDILHKLAALLLETETVKGSELDELIRSIKPDFEFSADTSNKLTAH